MILRAITENIPFIRSKNRSSNRLFLGHNSEIGFPSILFFSLECSPIVPFQKHVFSLEATYDGRNVEEWHGFTFLVLSQHAPGLEPIVSQAQLVEKCFALKEKGNAFVLTHIILSGAVSECPSEAGNARTMTWAAEASRVASIPGYEEFTHLSLRGIFICGTEIRRNKLIESSTAELQHHVI